MKTLPQGVRGVIYSYLDLMTIVDKLSKISKIDRDFIIQNRVVDQKRNLEINFKLNTEIWLDQLKYCM